MRHFVVTHEDGSRAAVPVNDSSTITLKTWAPPSFNDNGSASMPVLVDDQSFSLKGVAAVEVTDDAPQGAEIVQSEPPLEFLTDAQAAAMQAEAVSGEAPPPWEED